MASISRSPRLLLAAVLAALAVFAVGARAASASCSPNAFSVDPSCFEAGDGNLLTDHGGTDWQDWHGVAPPTFVQKDDDNGDSQFGTGSKEQGPGGWELNNGSAPSKSDILHAAYATETLANTNVTPNRNDLFLYGAFQRLAGSGDANVSFELNATPGTFFNGTSDVPIRSEGDLLITFDGNNSNGVKVGMCIWHGDRWGDTNNALAPTVDSNGDPIDRSTYGWYTLGGFGNGGHKLKGSDNCTTLSGSNASAIGSMNQGDAVNQFGGNKIIDNMSDPIADNDFGEMSVDITAALVNNGVQSPCLDFGSIWLHSRSSDAPLSDMQDYVGPSAIRAGTDCAINLEKDVAVQKAGDPNAPPLSAYEDADTASSAVYASTGDTLHYLITVTNPGANPITLDTDPPTDTKCSSGLTLVDKVDKNGVSNPLDNVLDPGDTWTYSCTHVFGDPATDGNLYDNTASVVGHEGNTNGCQFGDALPCVSDNDPAFVKRTGTIVIVKDRLPGTSSDSFAFGTSTDLQAQGANDFTLSDDGVAGHDRTSFDVIPNDGGGGSYVVSEKDLSDPAQQPDARHYNLTSIDCPNNGTGGSTSINSDQTAGSASVVVGSGDTVTCTFQNTKQAHLVFDKASVPAGSSSTFDFLTSGLTPANPTLDANGDPSDGVDSSAEYWIPAADFGTKTVDENVPAGWDLTSIGGQGCTGVQFGSNGTYAGAAFDPATDTGFSVNVGAGDDVACTFTNTQRGSVEVTKVNQGGVASDSFAFTPSRALDPQGFSLQGGQTKSYSDVVAGSYSVSEGTASGYRLTSIDCVDSRTSDSTHASSSSGLSDRTAQINVQPGEDVHCTFTNTAVNPRIAIDKSGPATAQAGALVPYRLVVTNPTADVSLHNVTVSDPRCTTAVTLQAENRGSGADPTPNTLDPGDSWVYSCSVQTTSSDTRVDNVATACGLDEFSRQVCASDSAATVLEQQQVLPERIVHGAAHLAGRTGCVSRAFYAVVRGKQISKVVFRIDGKRRAVVKRPDAKGRYKLRVDPRKFKPGSHLLKARSVFVPDSQTASKTLRLRFARCVRHSQPAFTG